MVTLRQKLWTYGLVGVTMAAANGLHYVRYLMNAWADWMCKPRNGKEIL